MERKWWTLIAVSVAIFMLLLDITVVNVALPDIQRSLHSSFSDLQWVVNAYALTLAAFLLTAGSLADLFGRRLVFTTGLVVFTCSSAVCGLSDMQKGQVKELMILSHRRRAQACHDGAGRGYRAEAMNRRELRHEFRSILTPDQFAKLQAARAARRQAREAQAAAPSAAPAAP